MSRRLEVMANVALIVASSLVGAATLRNQLWASRQRAHDRLRPGAKLSLPGEERAAKGPALVLVLQRECRFCSESAPFYRRLASEARGRGVHLIAALPHGTTDARRYLDALDVPVEDVRQVRLDRIKVEGTPTLIALDRSGLIKRLWLGKLAPDGEAEVLASLRDQR